MSSEANKGNRPEAWEKLLETLDEKLQLGLLDRLKNAISYHFEADVLYIEPGDDDDAEYLSRDAVFQQLQLFAQDVTKVEKVKIRRGEFTS